MNNIKQNITLNGIISKVDKYRNVKTLLKHYFFIIETLRTYHNGINLVFFFLVFVILGGNYNISINYCCLKYILLFSINHHNA